jgi:hypothetical protein
MKQKMEEQRRLQQQQQQQVLFYEAPVYPKTFRTKFCPWSMDENFTQKLQKNYIAVPNGQNHCS